MTSFSLSTRQKRFAAGALILLPVLFNLVSLSPEVSFGVIPYNDHDLHFPLVLRMVEALKAGDNPVDDWVPYYVMGYPVFRYYQFLPHLLTALACLALGSLLDAFVVFNSVNVLLMALFPLSVYLCMRWLGFSRLAALSAGLFAPVVSSGGLFGLEYETYVWRGIGAFTQNWGMALLPLSIGSSYRSVTRSRGCALPAVLLAACFLSHMIYGYMAALFVLLLVVLPPPEETTESFTQRLKAVFKILAGAFLLLLFYMLPFLRYGDHILHSKWEHQWKWDSFGHGEILPALLRGEYLDGGKGPLRIFGYRFSRPPFLTVMTIAGLVLALVRRERRNIFLAMGFAVSLFLFFGRVTWGDLIGILPFSRNIHFHRMIGGVQLFAVCLCGLSLSRLVPAVFDRRMTRRFPALHGLFLCLLLFGISYGERWGYLASNRSLIERNAAAFSRAGSELELLKDLERAVSARPGRVYTGFATNWGIDFAVGGVPWMALASMNRFDAVNYAFHAMSLSTDIQMHFDEGRVDHYGIFGIRYVLCPCDRPLPTVVRERRGVNGVCFKEVDVNGYFELIEVVGEYLPGDQKDLIDFSERWLRSSLPAAGYHVALRYGRSRPGETLRRIGGIDHLLSVYRGVEPRAGNDRGRILAENVDRNRYSTRVEVKRGAHLLFKMTYDPDWKCIVDGREAPFHMASPTFIALPLDAGTHDVTFLYSPGRSRYLLLLPGLVFLGYLIARDRGTREKT